MLSRSINKIFYLDTGSCICYDPWDGNNCQVYTLKPNFIYPTKINESCLGISSNTTFNEIVIVKSTSLSDKIQDIQTESSIDIIKSNLSKYQDDTLASFINISWTPSSVGVSTICFVGVSVISTKTEQLCFFLASGYDSPRYIRNSTTMMSNVYQNKTEWIIYSDKILTRPKFSSLIKFIDNSSKSVVFSIDVMNSTDVTIDNNQLIFKTSSFLVQKNNYYIIFDFGILTSDEACHVNSDEVKDPSFWQFHVRDTVPPNLYFYSTSTFVVFEITISWYIYEQSLIEWKLLYLNGTLRNGSLTSNYYGSVYLNNLQFEGSYKFLIHAIDLENNTADYEYIFTVDKTPPILMLNNLGQALDLRKNSLIYSCTDNNPVRAMCMFSFLNIGYWFDCNNDLNYYANNNYYKNYVQFGLRYYLFIKCVDSVNLESFIKNVSLLVDFEPPSISLVHDVFIDCDSSPSSIGYPNVSDNLSSNVSLAFLDQQQSSCVINRTWIARDESGNEKRANQILKQNNSGIFANLTSKLISIDCEVARFYLSGFYLQSSLVTTSQCGRSLKISYIDSNNFTVCNTSIIRKWIISADCNTGVELEQEITINPCKLKCSDHGFCDSEFYLLI